MNTGSTLTPEQAAHVDNLDRLWEVINDCVSSGRLTEADIPDDFQALNEQMETCIDSLNAGTIRRPSQDSPDKQFATKAGSILTPEQAAHIENLDRLWDIINDCVSSGRLTEADIPDDFQALNEQMETCIDSLWKT